MLRECGSAQASECHEGLSVEIVCSTRRAHLPLYLSPTNPPAPVTRIRLASFVCTSPSPSPSPGSQQPSGSSNPSNSANSSYPNRKRSLDGSSCGLRPRDAACMQGSLGEWFCCASHALNRGPVALRPASLPSLLTQQKHFGRLEGSSPVQRFHKPDWQNGILQQHPVQSIFQRCLGSEDLLSETSQIHNMQHA